MAEDNLQKATNLIQELGNFDFSGVFGFFDSGVGAIIWFFVKVFFFATLAALAALLYWKFWLRYNVRIEIQRETSGGGTESKRDRALRYRDEENKLKLQFFWMRNGKRPITMPEPGAKYRVKEGKHDKYYVFVDDNFNAHPIEPVKITEPQPQTSDVLSNRPTLTTEETKLLQVRPQERDAWARLEERSVDEKFKKPDKFMQAMPYMSYVAVGVIIFLIFFFATKELGSGLAEVASAFRQVAASCTGLTGE